LLSQRLPSASWKSFSTAERLVIHVDPHFFKAKRIPVRVDDEKKQDQNGSQLDQPFGC
jgi:hypothetical protein